MTKVINLELAKRLAPYLENVETEYFYWKVSDEFKLTTKTNNRHYLKHLGDIKTLTLEEAIEFIPERIKGKYGALFNLDIDKNLGGYMVSYENYTHGTFYSKLTNDYAANHKRLPLIDAIEKMLTYLLDNNLLGQKN